MGMDVTVSLRLSGVAALALLGGLTACHTPRGAPAGLPPPALQLASSAPLQLPETCNVEGSVAVEFAVLPDGQTGDIKPIAGPECARSALAAWVSSFRYVPPSLRTPWRIEWLVVSASRKS
jgi:hypothetical protein